MVAVFLSTAPLAVASFTDRRAYAAAFLIGLFLISATVSGALTECRQTDASGECRDRVAGEGAKWLSLVSVGEAPTMVNDIIFGNEDDGASNDLPRSVPVLLLKASESVLANWPAEMMLL